MREELLMRALEFYGEAPFSGEDANENILKLLRATSYPVGTSDEVPWCSAFLCYLFAKIGRPTPANASAYSWLKYGTTTGTPVLGDIVLFQWREGEKYKHHVGIFIRAVGSSLWVLGGNQNNEVDICLWKNRSVLSYRKLMDD